MNQWDLNANNELFENGNNGLVSTGHVTPLALVVGDEQTRVNRGGQVTSRVLSHR